MTARRGNRCARRSRCIVSGQRAPANYAAPCALLEGAWARARGHRETSGALLARAIGLAEEHQLPMISALAHEEAAASVRGDNRPRRSEQMLAGGLPGLAESGHRVRAQRLVRAHPWLLSRDLVEAGSAKIDPASAHQVVHSLPTARTPDGLAKILLGTVADSTGAARVLLLAGEGEQLRSGPSGGRCHHHRRRPMDRGEA